ncbi:hypothetical protein HYS90_02045 [Candidatus Curtissbacteria bacterium]|nr:hypothetical protein [Candidatus Curtissbacteria bacterium]
MDTKSKIVLTFALIFGGLGLLFVFGAQNVGKLRIIACDVGQGDGLLVITPSGQQVVIDGGPGAKIVDCLGQKMPFWDRTIELVVLTHSQRDHLEGLIEVLTRYKVKMIVTTNVKNDTEVFKVWQEAVRNEGARVYEPDVGDQFTVQGLSLDVLWPQRDLIEQWKVKSPKDLNESSIVMRLSSGQFCTYLTGDIPKEILEKLIDKPCQVLKIAHHGSKTGTNEQVLDLAKPQIAIIQVGKNSFGHPHREVLDLLTSKGVKILRNDTNGIIEIELRSVSKPLRPTLAVVPFKILRINGLHYGPEMIFGQLPAKLLGCSGFASRRGYEDPYLKRYEIFKKFWIIAAWWLSMTCQSSESNRVKCLSVGINSI